MNTSAKDFLSQAYRIDQRINSKLEQVQSLRALAEKAISTLSDSTPGATRNIHRMEDVITKIVDLESEINADIDGLVELKRNIITAINSVNMPVYRTLLELRYLGYKTFWEIGGELGADPSTVHRWHSKALDKITIPQNLQ